MESMLYDSGRAACGNGRIQTNFNVCTERDARIWYKNERCWNCDAPERVFPAKRAAQEARRALRAALHALRARRAGRKAAFAGRTAAAVKLKP